MVETAVAEVLAVVAGIALVIAASPVREARGVHSEEANRAPGLRVRVTGDFLVRAAAEEDLEEEEEDLAAAAADVAN